MTDAVPITQLEFEEMMKLHQLWLDGQPGGVQANLYNRDLRGFEIDGLNLNKSILRFADFSAATIRSATFNEAFLKNAAFHQATIDLCSFASAELERVNYSHATIFDSSFIGADLCCANFRHARIERCDLRNTLLEGLRIE